MRYEQKRFFKKGLLGTGMFVASASLGNTMQNEIDEIEPLEPIGYNHLPNTDSKIKENSVIHKADSRGKADHGWLLSQHTFSFANYYNPERMHFGVLRVLNDDRVEAGRGFGTHPHDNMEIISIPLEGDLEHKDSMGNTAVIKSGDIQVMSAGTGIMHSEFNKNSDQLVKFLQIWVYPKKRNVTPRYDQITLDKTKAITNSSRFFSQMLMMKAFGFTRMRGFTWELLTREKRLTIISERKETEFMPLSLKEAPKSKVSK